jgi:hypothetical protein
MLRRRAHRQELLAESTCWPRPAVITEAMARGAEVPIPTDGLR